jgi:hypothetical protein
MCLVILQRSLMTLIEPFIVRLFLQNVLDHIVNQAGSLVKDRRTNGVDRINRRLFQACVLLFESFAPAIGLRLFRFILFWLFLGKGTIRPVLLNGP